MYTRRLDRRAGTHQRLLSAEDHASVIGFEILVAGARKPVADGRRGLALHRAGQANPERLHRVLDGKLSAGC